MNICFPRFLTEEEAVLADYEKKFAELQKNGAKTVLPKQDLLITSMIKQWCHSHGQ